MYCDQVEDTERHICWVIYLLLKHKGRPPRKKDISGEYGFCRIHIKQYCLNFNLNASDLEIYSVDILKAMSLASLPKLWEFCWCSGHSLSVRSAYTFIRSDQIRSVAQSCPTLCNPMNRSMPGLPVHHQLPEFTQTHAHRVSDTIQPSHPLSSSSPPAPNPSQHQSLFQ